MFVTQPPISASQTLKLLPNHKDMHGVEFRFNIFIPISPQVTDSDTVLCFVNQILARDR
jgi:hypothetical protein